MATKKLEIPEKCPDCNRKTVQVHKEACKAWCLLCGWTMSWFKPLSIIPQGRNKRFL